MKYLALAFLLFPVVAYSGDHKPDPKPNKQEQRQEQNQAQEQSQNASVNVHDRLQAPSMGVPGISASASCYHGVSAGISVPGVGLGGGKMILDSQCELREAIRLAYAAGRFEAGDWALCQLDAFKGMENCPAKPSEPKCAPPEALERAVDACKAK